MDDGEETIAGIPLLAVLAVIGWQCYNWLVSGEWIPLTIFSALDILGIGYPKVNWVGVQKIIDGFLSWPLSGMLFLIAFVWAMFVFISFSKGRTKTD